MNTNDETNKIIEAFAMNAENHQRAINGESPAYTEQDFMGMIEPENQAVEQPKPWTPPEGEWYVNISGIPIGSNLLACEEYGNEYETYEAAQEQAELNKGFQWLCHLARHVNPSGRCMKPSESGYGVIWYARTLSVTLKYEGMNTVFETKEASEAAIEIMNVEKDRWKEIVG